MSADNAICVKKIKGKWWVWMTFASNDRHLPKNTDKSFDTKKEAMAYACGWFRGESVVEYGIWDLDKNRGVRQI